MTCDVPRGADGDAAAVRAHAREALAEHDHFLADAEQISADAKPR